MEADPPPLSRGAKGKEARAKGGGPGVGLTKVGKGMKIMAIADRSGLPLSVSVHAANHHETKLAQLSLDLCLCGEPANLIGDKAYDSDPLDAELRERGVEMIAPHRRTGRGPRRRTGAGCGGTSAAGSWNGSSRGFSGAAGSWSAGNIIWRTFSASSRPRLYVCC